MVAMIYNPRSSITAFTIYFLSRLKADRTGVVLIRHTVLGPKIITHSIEFVNATLALRSKVFSPRGLSECSQRLLFVALSTHLRIPLERG
jgi:hypothetical protein